MPIISATPEDHVRALATGDQQAAEALREALESEDGVVRQSVARELVKALGTAAEGAIEPIADLLQTVIEPFSSPLATAAFEAAIGAAERSKGSHESLLLIAVHACADEPALGERLPELMKHRNPRVRAVAVGAFGRAAGPETASQLLPLLEDAEPEVALAALDAALTLAIDAPEVLMPALAALLPKLEGEARYSALTGLRGVLRDLPALATRVGAALVPTVLQALSEDEDPALQFESCALLGLLPSTPESIAALTARLEHEPSIACCAAASLIELGGELTGPTKVLQRCCESADPEDQNAGFAALDQLTPKAVLRVAALLSALEKNPDPQIKESARAIRNPPE